MPLNINVFSNNKFNFVGGLDPLDKCKGVMAPKSKSDKCTQVVVVVLVPRRMVVVLQSEGHLLTYQF